MKYLFITLSILYSIHSFSQSFSSESQLMKIVLESSQSIEQKQDYAIRKYKEYSSKMGNKTTRFVINQINATGEDKGLFINFEYILDKVTYNGREFENVNVISMPFFKNMNSAYSEDDKIIIALNSRGRRVKATFENGYEDVGVNTNDITITIDDYDIREATLTLIKYLIDNPYYKGS